MQWRCEGINRSICVHVLNVKIREKQNEIINRNCRDIKEYGDALAAKNEQFSKKTNKRV